MLQYDTRLLDRSRNFNRAGAIGQNIGRTIKDIVAASRQRRKHGMAQQAFQGYNPQTDPEGMNYRQRQKDYYNALRDDWRTSDEGHQGLQAVQQQEIEARNRRVQEERNRLDLDSARIQNKLKMVQYDQFRNDMLDETLTFMAQSPEKYEAGIPELQKHFSTELQQMGLPETFNKDAQAKILMRRGVSKRISALNDQKRQELEALEEKAWKRKKENREYSLKRDRFDFDKKKYQQDYELKEKQFDYQQQQTKDKQDKALLKIQRQATLDAAPQQAIVSQINSLKDLYKDLSEKGGAGMIGGAITESPLSRFVGGKEKKEIRARFSTARDGLVINIQKAFEGARPSDKDREFYKQLIGSAFGSPDYFNAKIGEFQNMITGRIEAYQSAVKQLEGSYNRPLTQDEKTEVLESIPLDDERYHSNKKNIQQLREEYGY